MEKDEDPEWSKAVSFNLSQIFPGDFEFAEVSLAANMWIGDLDRLKFKQEGAANSLKEKAAVKGFQVLSNLEITMKPMEIRTFIMSSPHITSHGARSQEVFQIFPFLILFVLFKTLVNMFE